MSIPRSPSIENLERTAHAYNDSFYEDEAQDRDDLRLITEKFDEVTRTCLEFNAAFDAAAKTHDKERLKAHLVTILPKDHKVPLTFF